VPGADELGDDALLFSESNSRFIITCAPSDCAEVEQLFADVPLGRVGEVVDAPRLRVAGVSGRIVIDAEVPALRKAFKETLHGL
jgi:phosphoribosylformylglycinamidine synthase